ncbi:MAG: TonB-dependent receptor, partial [Myxococcota bacterium]|nr:TonB-dependent receptor [Myxococcota bacterium]
NGNIKGVVVDDGGLPVPGVVVTVTSDNLMGERQGQSDANGQYIINELPPGSYKLVASRPGFSKYVRPTVVVRIGQNAIINIIMNVDEAGAEIVVEESRNVIDTESGNQGSVLTKEFLQRIPAGRSYQAAAQLAAGVTGGANPNIAGASSNENTYMVDGINITDPVTGTFSLNFNFDAIEQLQVLTSAYDPEYGQNLGGSINIVTDSGGNTLQFNLYSEYQNGVWGPKRDEVWAADGTQLAPTDFDSRFDSMSLSALVSGPIVRDRVWFIASYQYSRTLIARSGIDLPRDFDGHYVLGKLTYSPNASHRFTWLAQTNPTTIDNTDQVTRFIYPEAQGRQAQGGWLNGLKWEWYISPEQYLETQATINKIYLERSSVPCTHNKELGYNPCNFDEFENSIDFTTVARYGISNAFDSGNYPLYDFDDRWRAVFSTKYSLLQLNFLGTHDIKTGIQTDILSWDKVFGLTGNMRYYDLNELAYNPDTYKNYYWVEYSGPLNYQTTSNQISAFIQDVYKPISNLTFRYGTRYDRSIFRNDVGDRIIDVGIIQPRVSI